MKKFIFTTIVSLIFGLIALLADYFTHSSIYFSESKKIIEANVESFKQRDGLIQYAISSQEIRSLSEPAFTPQYQKFKKYQISINNELRLLATHSTFPILPLLPKDLKGELILISIRSNEIEENQKLETGKKPLIAPISELQAYSVLSQRSDLNLKVLWVLPFLTITILFGLLALFNKGKSNYIFPTLLSFLFALSELFSSNSLSFLTSFKSSLIIFCLIKVFIGILILNYFRAKFLLKKITIAYLFFIPFLSLPFTGLELFTILETLRWPLFVGIILSLLSSLRKQIDFKRSLKEGSYQTKYTLSLFSFSIVYLLLLSSSFYHLTPLLELALCLMIITNIIFELNDYQSLSQIQKTKIQRSQKDIIIGKTATSMAHDLRRPFQLMRYFFAVENVQIKSKAEILKAIDEATEILNSTMDYSRESFYELETVNTQELIEQTISTYSVMYKGPEIEIIIKLNQIYCLAVKSKLKRVIQNLIDNAAREMSGGNTHKEIRLESKLSDSHTFTLSIFNSGTQIDERVIQGLTENSMSFNNQGTGRGLASSANLIHLLQGKLNAVNTAKGVQFNIHLKPSKKESKPFLKSFKIGEEYRKTLSKRNRQSILIVHDSPLTCEYLSTIISSMNLGVSVNILETVEAALTDPDLNQYSIIISDFFFDQSGGKLTGDILHKNILSKERFLLFSEVENQQEEMNRLSTSSSAEKISKTLKALL